MLTIPNRENLVIIMTVCGYNGTWYSGLGSITPNQGFVLTLRYQAGIIPRINAAHPLAETVTKQEVLPSAED